ncbi:hypothetical protein [Streptococcus orisratti]
MASDTTPQTVITEQESLDTFSELEGTFSRTSKVFIWLDDIRRTVG